jgi:hypothetical protein
MLMQASDFKVKNESGAPPTKKKRKPTPAQIEASRRNSQSSTGPRDTSKTRLNALRHGCAAELPVLMPGENREEVQNKIDRYITQLGAQTDAERDCCELAVMNYVRAKRANAADVAAGTRVVNEVLDGFEDRQCLRCDELVANLPVAPATTIIQLRGFSHGIHYLLSQIELLEEQLQTACSFHRSQRVLAIRLSGRKPENLFTDPIVRQWNIHYLSGLHGRGKITAAQAALRLLHQLQRMRLNHGEQLGATVEEPEPAPTGGECRPDPGAATGGEGPSQPAGEAVYGNEAGATQVAGGSARSNEPRTFSVVNFTIERPESTTERPAARFARPHRGDPDSSEVLRE